MKTEGRRGLSVTLDPGPETTVKSSRTREIGVCSTVGRVEGSPRTPGTGPFDHDEVVSMVRDTIVTEH